MSRSYLTVERVTAVMESLSERDWLILESIRRVKVATGKQLERLRFDSPDTDPAALARHRRRVLTRPTEHS